MIDLTAPMEKYGVSPDITHMDLYYLGETAPMSSLVTECVLIDLTQGAESVDLESLPELALVKQGMSVILKTGWERYRGTAKYDDSPWVDRQFIEWLVNQGVCLVLIDSPGVYGGTSGAEHNEIDQYLADHHAYAVENLVNVGQISEPQFKLYCFPIAMSGQNNAPCRVVAEVG